MTEKRNLYSQSLHPNGRDKGAIISMETYQYDIIFCGGEHYGEQTKICHGQIDRF